MTRHTTLLVTLVVGGAAAGAAWAQTPARAYVLDSGANKVVVIDLTSARRIAELPLEGTPSRIRLSPDDRYFVVLDRGPGEDRKERGYEAKGRSSATIIDAAALKIIGRAELGFGLEPGSMFFPEGRMALLCEGYDAKTPKESLPRELVTLDLATARETGRLTLEPGTFFAAQGRDGRTLALVQGRPPREFPAKTSRVRLVDLAGPTFTATLAVGPWRDLYSDGDRVYFIHPGKADKDPRKNQNATIDVVTLSQPGVGHVDAGGEAVTGAWAGDLVLLAGSGPPGGTAGELRAFRGGSLAATLAVAEKPRLVWKVDEMLYVVGSKAVTLVDAKTLAVSGTIPLSRGAEAIVGDGDHPFELAVTADRRRAFIHYPAEDKVAVLDLEQRKAIGSAKTGRGGKKLFNSMMSTLTYGATERVFHYGAGDPPQIQVGRDGRFAYALNLDTNDVTVVDADTAQAVEKIGGGGYEVRLLGGPIVAVVGSEIHLIDASRNVKTDQIRLPGLRGMVASDDAAFTVALAERTVLVFDGATGKERARLTDFVKPMRVAIAPTAPPPSP